MERCCFVRPGRWLDHKVVHLIHHIRLLNEQSERLKSDSSIAKSLLSQAPQIEISDKFECDEVGAWFFVANALLNLDETITKG